MSYCTPYFISEFTYTALFDRFVIVNKAARTVPPADQADRVYARLHIKADGTLEWRAPVELRAPPVGFSTKSVTVMTKTGPEVITGQYYPYDHIEGGELLWLQPSAPTTSVQVEVQGKIRELAQ